MVPVLFVIIDTSCDIDVAAATENPTENPTGRHHKIENTEITSKIIN